VDIADYVKRLRGQGVEDVFHEVEKHALLYHSNSAYLALKEQYGALLGHYGTRNIRSEFQWENPLKSDYKLQFIFALDSWEWICDSMYR
jgi:hypothetical protein